MMRIFSRFNYQRTECEVNEELHFHLDLLTEELYKQDLSMPAAKDAALKRFGNVEQIKDQCVAIRKRSNSAVGALKSFLVLLFLLGVLLRIFSPEYHVTHVADILITVGILGRVLVYLRVNPSNFHAEPETKSTLMLNDNGQASVAAYDQRKRTPVERVISDR